MDAKDIFKAYSILQEELCLTLMNLYSLKRDSEILDIPKSGMFFLKNKNFPSKGDKAILKCLDGGIKEVLK